MNYTDKDIQRAIDLINVGIISIEDITDTEFKQAVSQRLNP